MSDDGDVIPSVMQNGGNQYKIKEVSLKLKSNLILWN